MIQFYDDLLKLVRERDDILTYTSWFRLPYIVAMACHLKIELSVRGALPLIAWGAGAEGS